AVTISQSANRIAALLGRDACGEAVAHVHRDGEGGPEGSLVLADHRIELQVTRVLGAERRADDTRRIADDECHFFRRAERSGDEQVTLVLAVVIIGDHHDLASGEGFDRRVNALVVIRHVLYLERASSGRPERPRRPLAHLAAMHEIVVGQHARYHGFAYRDRADADARVVAA